MKIPLATIERIMRNAGAESVSEGAVDELRDSTQGIAEEVARDAVTHAQEDERSNVTLDDMKKALEV